MRERRHSFNPCLFRGNMYAYMVAAPTLNDLGVHHSCELVHTEAFVIEYLRVPDELASPVIGSALMRV